MTSSTRSALVHQAPTPSGRCASPTISIKEQHDFEADGPLPLAATFDHGFELSGGKFVVPKKLMLYLRGSAVFGEFRDSHEYAGGLEWHFLPTERLWLSAELMRVMRVPYSGGFTRYTAGMTGWVPMIQTVLAF